MIVMETELWPNLFYACEKNNVPLVIANARLSAQSAGQYQWVSFALPMLFHPIHQLLAQTKADADRFIQLGLPDNKIVVTGNLKFDLEIPSELAEKSVLLRKELGEDRFIWVAASTHPGEEEKVLEVHRKLLEKNPSALLILVPRHPDRFQGVATLCKEKEFETVKRSEKRHDNLNMHIYLGDTMGELLLMYSVCDVAFVGGSFVEVGGHNMIEPAVLHKPILTGPYLFNFTEVSELLIKAGGMKVVKTTDQLTEALQELIQHPEKRKDMGEKAYQTIAMNRGALDRQMNAIYKVFNV
jgi:3-deoxy-D-manno-octulosonic-acid transferase